MLRSDGLCVFCLFFVPAALSWITEKNTTTCRTGIRVAVNRACWDLQMVRLGWQVWGAGCAKWSGSSASPGGKKEGGEFFRC